MLSSERINTGGIIECGFRRIKRAASGVRQTRFFAPAAAFSNSPFGISYQQAALKPLYAAEFFSLAAQERPLFGAPVLIRLVSAYISHKVTFENPDKYIINRKPKVNVWTRKYCRS